MATTTVRSQTKKRNGAKKTTRNSSLPAAPPAFDPCGPTKQPEWLETEFPDLVGHPHHNPLTSTREFAHLGHSIRIVTTYEIVVDGKPMQTHAMVDEEGQLWCHAIPYLSFPSASEMVRHIIDEYADVMVTRETLGDGGHAPGHSVDDHSSHRGSKS